MIEPISKAELFGFTSQLAGAYIAHHAVSVEEISPVITKIYSILSDIVRNPRRFKDKPSKLPAVPIEDSVQDAYLVCLEDGKKLQILKRHLGTVYNMSLEEYKDRWNLPLDYPSVSPSYARRRSQIAKKARFGLVGRPHALKRVSEQGTGDHPQRIGVVG